MRMTLLALALAAAWPATAATVYKTVDAEGKVSFSDTPPAAGASAEVIELPESRNAPDPAAAERLQQMRETTDRLREDRLARERERAQQFPPAASYPAPAPDEATDDDSRWLVPYYPPYRRWHDGGHRPRPPYRPPGPPPHARPEPPPSGSAAHSPRGLTQRLREAR